MDTRFNAAEWLIDWHVAEGRGERVAVRCQGVDTTYRELRDEMYRVQCALADLGLGAGQRVVLVLDDDVTFPAWFLGAMRAGVVPVPLSTMLTGDELGPIVADAGASAVVLSASRGAVAGAIAAAAPELRTIIVAGGGSAEPVSVDRDDVAVIAWESFDRVGEHPVATTTVDSPAFWLYSSGTTGIPKGVMHVHGSMRATVDTYAREVLRVTEDDRFLSVAKLFFAYGLGNSLTFPFAVGATTILHPDGPTPAGFAELIEAERPTLFFASPGFAAALLDSDARPEQFASIRATVTAGETLPADVHQRFTAFTGRPVLDGIGSTELLHIFISNTLDEQRPGSTGVAVPGYDVELRNDDGDVVVEADTPGFLYVRGPSAAVGYHDRPDATAGAFDGGWVRTGDVYVRDDSGAWTFLGRNNDMIKAGGIWVSPAEVEAALIEHPDVLEVGVVGARNASGLEEVVAFIVPAAGAEPDPAELDAHCRSRMASFKRPRRIEVVDALPKTATGKIRRFALRERLAR